MTILFRPFGFIAPNTLNIWPSNFSILSVHDEGYSRNASCAINLISTFLFYFIFIWKIWAREETYLSKHWTYIHVGRMWKTNWATGTIAIRWLLTLNSYIYNLNLKLNFWCLTSLSAIFQLLVYHGDQF